MPRRDAPRSRSRPKPQHRKGTLLPLDASHLVQRPLDSAAPAGTVQLKSSTRHPTVFRKRILQADQQLRHGDLVRVAAEGKTIGYGLWNPRAEASVRILRWGEQPPDLDWWQARLSEAVALRHDLLKLHAETDAYRLINAEGDGFPGLVGDRYGDVLTLQAFSLGMYQRAEQLARALAERAGTPHWLVRPGPSTFEQEGFVADGFESGGVPEKVIIREHSLLYEIRPREGHKTGFFCDQRDNRQQDGLIHRVSQVADTKLPHRLQGDLSGIIGRQ
jgi:23S rRNA (cytosine1962-C5)-methyltransferase